MVTLPKSPPLPPDQTTIYRFPFGSIWVALQKTWLVPIDWVRKAGAIGVTSRAVRLYVRVKALRPLTTLTWPSRALRAEHPPSVHRSSSQSSKEKNKTPDDRRAVVGISIFLITAAKRIAELTLYI